MPAHAQYLAHRKPAKGAPVFSYRSAMLKIVNICGKTPDREHKQCYQSRHDVISQGCLIDTKLNGQLAPAKHSVAPFHKKELQILEMVWSKVVHAIQ